MNIENLKRARENAGLTQTQAAQKIGVSDGTYKNYEQGKREPNGDKIVTIANAFGVTTDYLLGRPTAQPPTDALERLFSEKSFSALEEELLRKYMELPHEARQAVVRFINDATAKALQRKNGTAPQKLLVMKRSLHKVSAGTGYDLNDSDAWETVTVKDTDDSRKADWRSKATAWKPRSTTAKPSAYSRPPAWKSVRSACSGWTAAATSRNWVRAA